MANIKIYPLVTIVMPSYNHEKYVVVSINSALQQRYPNIEVIIIDDGSTDNSVIKIREYLESLPVNKREIINFIARENCGLSGTLNQAISLMKSEYIVMLASDDVLTKNSLMRTVDCLIKDKEIAAVSGSVTTMNSDGQKLPIFFVKKQKKKFISFHEKFIESEAFFAPGSVFRKSAIISVGGFNKDIWVEDFYIQLMLLNSGFKLLRIKDVVAYYRRHENNSSNALANMNAEADKVRAMFSKRSDYQDLIQARNEYKKLSEYKNANSMYSIMLSKLKGVIKSVLIRFS